MFDQAVTLRRMMSDISGGQKLASQWGAEQGAGLNASHYGSVPRVLAITGGKGGVGKTLTTANLGLCFARLGMKTLLIDGDFGLANLDVVMGIRPQFTLDDVLAGERELADVILTGHDGVRVIPASSGVMKVVDLSRTHKLVLLDQIEGLDEQFDIVLIDTPAGVSRNVQYWTGAAAEVILVATPEPTSLADSYATMKILSHTTRETSFKLVVNMVRNEEEGLRVYDKLSTLADEFLNVKVEYVGSIPFDDAMRASVRERIPCVVRYPFSQSARGVRTVANQLLASQKSDSAKGTMQFFWRRMVSAGQPDLFG